MSLFGKILTTGPGSTQGTITGTLQDLASGNSYAFNNIPATTGLNINDVVIYVLTHGSITTQLTIKVQVAPTTALAYASAEATTMAAFNAYLLAIASDSKCVHNTSVTAKKI